MGGVSSAPARRSSPLSPQTHRSKPNPSTIATPTLFNSIHLCGTAYTPPPPNTCGDGAGGAGGGW